MYGFPADLDLSPAIGHETTQVCVGPYDLQFSFGPVAFAVQSRVELLHGDVAVAIWESGRWPEPAFYQMFNTPIIEFAVVDRKRLRLRLENGYDLQLTDTSERHESMQIYVNGLDDVYIV